jgi:large subunit ribosomal protein L10
VLWLVAQFEVVADQMTGPLIYGFSEDAVAAAKVVADFAKTNDKLVIRGGAFGGKALDVNGVKQLASIPSKEVLLAQLCGLLHVPHFPYRRVLGALAAKKGEGAAEAAPAEACCSVIAPVQNIVNLLTNC